VRLLTLEFLASIIFSSATSSAASLAVNMELLSEIRMTVFVGVRVVNGKTTFATFRPVSIDKKPMFNMIYRGKD
jgi:hypothetical protein